MQPIVSVIIPIYNSEKYLTQCLDSVFNQTYQAIEIICVNDGSNDNSLSILEDYAKKDCRVKIINKHNSGVSDTRNIGTAYASGKYIMYLDSDDWIEFNICEIAVCEAEKEKADVVFWNYIREFENVSKPKCIWGTRRNVFNEEDISALQRRFIGLYDEELRQPENADSIVPVWGKLYRKEVISSSGALFIDTNIVGTSEDALFNLEVFGFVHKVVYLPECYNHYRKENKMSFTKGYKENLCQQWGNLFDYIEKYITLNNYDSTFHAALSNRICLSIVGLGMNILRGDASLSKVKAIKDIISSENYRVAASQLKFKYFPIYWKVFFWLAKHNCSLGVYLTLVCIKKLKGS